MNRWGRDPAATSVENLEAARLLGLARLAYFTPAREYPALGDRKCLTLLALAGLTITVSCLFVGEIHAVLRGDAKFKWLAIVPRLSWFLLVLVGGRYAFQALTRPVLPTGRCVAYYQDVAAMSLQSYWEILEGLSHHGAMRAILNYNYGIAVVSEQKLGLIQRSVACLRLTLASWMLLMLIIILE